MKPFEEPTVSPWRWAVWLLFAVAWTTALVMPFPDDGLLGVVGELSVDRRYLFAKTLHVCAYAAFAALSGCLRVPLRWRWLLMFFLMAHGTLTELIQLKVVFRSGELSDVGFDNAGIFLGALLTWSWWTAD